MIHLSTFHPRPDSISNPQSRAILASAAGHYQPVRRHAVPRSSPSGRRLRYLLLALFLLTPLPNRARPDVLRLPFRSAHSMIVVQARVNGSQIALLLDTGATRTIVSSRVYGNVPFQLRSIERTSHSAGIVGDSVILPVNLELANHAWAGQRVAIMNLDGLSQIFGIQFDGLLGQDILREFHSVRIDYRNHTIELEE
jgi:hypothetical protein